MLLEMANYVKSKSFSFTHPFRASHFVLDFLNAEIRNYEDDDLDTLFDRDELTPKKSRYSDGDGKNSAAKFVFGKPAMGRSTSNGQVP